MKKPLCPVRYLANRGAGLKSLVAFDLNQYLNRMCERVDAALDKLLPPEPAEPPTLSA